MPNIAIRERGDSFERRVLAEQTRQLYDAVPGMLALTVGVSVLLVAIYWSLRPHELLLGWLALFVLVAAVRFDCWRRFRVRRPAVAAIRPWYRAVAGLTLASALVWGLAAWLFLVDGPLGHLGILAFVVAGLGAGGMVHLAPRWQVAWLFLIPTLLPFALASSRVDVPMGDAMAAFVLVFLIAMLIMSRRLSAQITRQIREGLEQSDRTERSQREWARYQSLVESTRAIVWEGSTDNFAFSYISPGVEALLGYPVECWIEDPEFWIDHMHPVDRKWAPDQRRTMTRLRRDHAFDYRMIAASGGTVWLRDSVKILVRDGEPDRLVGVMIDITELKSAQQELEYSSGLQRLMVEAAQQFLNTSEGDFDRILDDMLARAGAWCDADRAYLIRFTPDLSQFTNTHEWTAEGIRPEIDSLQNVASDTIPAMLPALQRGETTIVHRVADLPDEWASERALLQAQQIRSLLALPILAGEQLIGLVGFDAVRAERRWTQQEVDVLRLLANLVGAALQHEAMELRLRASERLRANAESLAVMGSWEWRIGTEDFNASDEWRRVMGCGPGPLSRDEVLALTPEIDREQVMLALQHSVETGQAYEIEHRIVRPCDGEERWVRVHAEVFEDPAGNVMRGFAQDITERKRDEAKLFELAHYDSLTGLPNRLLMLDRLQRALQRARRNGSEVAVLFLDLDQFKKINDTFGHDEGDLVLVEAADRLLDVVRDQATVARIGGDEFMIVLEDFASLGDVIALSTKLLDGFRRPLRVNGREFTLTASIGIAVSPHDGANAPDLMRNADTAMYHAKKSGRDAVQFFTAAMNASVRRQLEVEHALRGAIERGEVRVEYQPLLRLPDCTPIGAEALLRWRHPELGDVSPQEFVEVAEQSGLIAELGQFVFADALARLPEWRARVPDFFVSVNVSPRQFRDLDLVGRLIADLDRAEVPGSAVELEVTEGLLMSGRREVLESLEQLRSHGIGLVMDDFGTGYASLGYLRDYPFSSIKIDRSFVEGMDRDARKRKLVTSAIRLAHALDLTVIAEGVETRRELDVLLAERCSLAQGFLFAPALPPERLSECLAEARERFTP